MLGLASFLILLAINTRTDRYQRRSEMDIDPPRFLVRAAMAMAVAHLLPQLSAEGNGASRNRMAILLILQLFLLTGAVAFFFIPTLFVCFSVWCYFFNLKLVQRLC